MGMLLDLGCNKVDSEAVRLLACQSDEAGPRAELEAGVRLHRYAGDCWQDAIVCERQDGA